MEFCLSLTHHPWTRARAAASAPAGTIDAIRAADAAGLESVWVSEDPDGWDAFAVLGAAARETSRIRLGTGVTNPFLRHPNLLSMSVATLDRLSGGRAFLGIGRGQPEWYRERLGIEADRPLEALEETIDLLRQWWQPPHRASVDGHFHIRDWARAIGPVQDRVPIYLAALGPRALALAARKADGVLIAEFASLPFLTTMIAEVRDRLAQASRQADDFAFYARTAIEVTDDPEPALERRKNLLALVHTLPGMARQIVVPGFDVEEILARVREVMHTDELLAEGGAFIDIRQVADFEAARRIIPTELVESISFVGRPEQVRDKLRALQDVGVTHAFVSPPKSTDPAELADIIASVRP